MSVHKLGQVKSYFENEVPLARSKLITEQEKDLKVVSLTQHALPAEDLEKVSQNGVLMRKWRLSDVPESEDWSIVHQIVIPKAYRSEILEVTHELPMSGHLSINKTSEKNMRHFF